MNFDPTLKKKKTTISVVEDMATAVGSHMGCGVHVSRERRGDQLQYFIDIEGCHPSRFGPMTIGEVKSRLAMFMDMFICKVIQKG